jgi:hypothetical protein
VTTPDLIPLAVSTDRLPDDSYAAVVSIGGDLSWTLPAPRARRYAAAVVDAATAAEHDAATYGALTCKGIPEELVAEVILRAREERPPADRWTDPLTVVRGIQAVAAAELDSALVRALAALSVPSETRAAVVDHVGRHWPSSGGSFPSEDL